MQVSTIGASGAALPSHLPSGEQRETPRQSDNPNPDLSPPSVSLDEAADLAGLFRLLGDPTRVRILYAILEAGELCVCDIASAVATTETKVSQALRLLRSAGVVRNRRDGRNIYYRLDDTHVRMTLDLCREHLSHGTDHG